MSGHGHPKCSVCQEELTDDIRLCECCNDQVHQECGEKGKLERRTIYKIGDTCTPMNRTIEMREWLCNNCLNIIKVNEMVKKYDRHI